MTALTCCLLAACSTSNEPLRIHSLLAAEPGQGTGGVPERVSAGRTQAARVQAARPVRLSVAPIGVPSALDQPQWLVRRSDGSLQLLEQDRWASPLADEVRAALREGLAERWGVVEGNLPVSTGPTPGVSSGAAPPLAWRLVVDVQRLDANPGRDSLLQARWTLLPPERDQAPISCAFRVSEPVQGLSTLTLAEAHRRAVQRLADDIGAQLLRWESGDRSRLCGGPPTAR